MKTLFSSIITEVWISFVIRKKKKEKKRKEKKIEKIFCDYFSLCDYLDEFQCIMFVIWFDLCG